MSGKFAICAAAFAVIALLPLQAPLAQTAPAGAIRSEINTSAFNDLRVRFLQSRFKSLLDKSGAYAGAVCLAENGNVLLAKSFPESPGANAQTFPIGKSSAALSTLAAAAMQKEGKLNLKESVSSFCSYFRLSGSASRASLEQVWSGEYGFDEHADSLVPQDASAAELFDIAAQIPPTAQAGINSSKLAPALAGYALGYIADKSQKNFKKSFVKTVHNYVFSPLKMDGVKYRAFDSPLFAATAFALAANDTAKWLACETDPSPKIATAQLISERRKPSGEEKKFSMGWIKTSKGKTEFSMCGDYFQNCANIVAVFADGKIAAAFFAKSQDQKSASQACADGLSLLIEMLQNPAPHSK